MKKLFAAGAVAFTFLNATGHAAVQLLLDQGFEAGILPHHVKAEFVEI